MNDSEKKVVASPFSSFEFSRSAAKRRQPLSSVMPVNSGFHYAVLLTDAYLSYLGLDVPIRDFAHLCASCNDASALDALVSVRKSGSLTEGRKFLPVHIVDFLMSVGGPDLYIRFDDDGELTCNNLNEESLKADILASQSVHDGEFEVCDTNGVWYLRFRDDEPVMFFAARAALVDELTRRFPSNSMAVPSDFIFSS